MSMKMLGVRIAWRYLWAPKSYSAVSAISIVAVTGVAIATAAIICVLSVFNGFRSVINDRLDSLASDIEITPAKGKTISNGDSIASLISNITGVELASPQISDQALLIANAREMPVTLKGVKPKHFSTLTAIDTLIYDGYLSAFSQDTKGALVSIGIAYRLGMHELGGDLFVFAPKKEGRINLANPMNSFRSDSLSIRGFFQSMQNEYDENTLICDIEVAKDIFEYEDEATSINVKVSPGISEQTIVKEIKSLLGENYVVKDRIMQQEINFRMVNIEKWVTFLLLVFILLIASFNIISTVSMLVIEKDNTLHLLRSLGMRRGKIKMIFSFESLFVACGGGFAGIIIGIILCLLQEKYGFIKLNANPDAVTVNAYPVTIEWMDIFWTMIPIVSIGLFTALIAYGFAGLRLRRAI